MKKRTTLFHSFISLLLCVSMLVGTTFAWFTDSVVTGINTIAAGTLDVELYHSNAAATDERVDSATKLFMDLQGNPILWEPGAVSYENLRIANEGDLALAYQLAMRTANENHVVDPSGAQYGLSQILKVGVVENGITATDRAGVVASVNAANWTTLAEFLQGGSLLPEGKGEFEKTWGIVIYWEPGENDNYWNLNNDKVLDQGEYLMIDLGISLIATQEEYESDSFGSDYDAEAKAFLFPDYVGGSASAPVVPDAENKTSAQVSMSDGHVSAVVPAGVLLETGVTELKLTVTPMNASGANIALGENEDLRALDVHVEGVSADNTVPMIIDLGEVMPVGLNMGNYKLYHVEDGANNAMTLVASEADFNAHNQFKYDPATGDITLYMATFSEVALVADQKNAWNGNYDYSWYTNAAAPVDSETVTEYIIANADELAGFGAIVGGMAADLEKNSFKDKTVKLIADINLGDKESENNTDLIFYPIGYNSDDGKYEKTGVAVTTGFYSFEGTFDGQGHTISNFYQNTWEMKGDNNYYDATLQYYRDGMGLFGKVYGGTVKNLTVANFSSDGEYTTTGVIAAYADGATFENIAITECNPRVYNIGNGGMVGCVGWYAKDADLKTTFKNITVDNSNKISALWGSYDVACGGIVGQYYPTSGQTSAGTPANGGIEFENCHVAAQMDVYNDVCGNYQYYAYRYAGMLIGSVRENVTIDGHVYPKMDGITAKDCTVHFGTWNDYYYCEFEKNGHPSYSGPDDYKFSRVPNNEIDTSKGKENATCIGHNHSEVEDNQAIYLPFNNLVTGYGWGVTTKVVGELDGVKILDREVADSVVKFETKFTGNFLYRVGNGNTVSVGSLFEAAAFRDENGDPIKENGKIKRHNISSAGVIVSVDKVDENSNVSGAFTANTTDWTKGTIQFSGTGVVKVTIQDYDYCKTTELYLEVVDAVNATSATSATKNNVVLLNDCGFSSLEVSGGYTLYGNGFTMTCGSDSAALDMGYSFVTLNNGTLDNVQIVCPNFDYAALYKSNLTSNDNRSETDANGKTRYYNAKSGVMASGNSQILNSRISGGRAALNVSGGNVVVDNSRIDLGAVASVLVGAANRLTLRDVTLVQKPAASTYDSSKSLMGFSVLYMCDSEGKATPTTLEGRFVQQAWVNADDKQYVPSAGQDIVDGVMKETSFIHSINGKDSLNLGFAYMPEDAQKTVAAPDNITDNRTDKAAIPYEMKDVKIQISLFSTTVYVYSYKNTNGTDDSFKNESDYKPNKYGDIITVAYSDIAEGLTTGKSYGTDGWVYELNVDLDKLSGYALDFSKLSMTVNGTPVSDFKVNGNAKPTSPVAVTAGGTTYTLTATVGGKEYTATYKVTGTEASKESPSLVASNYEAGLCVASSYGGTWHGAAPALEGIQIKYWSVAEKQYKTINLSDYTPTTKGKQNGTNTTWTYSPDNGDFTLTLTGGQVHSSNNVYAMPVVCDGKLYFVAASSKGLVNSGNSARTIPVSYSFKDNNNGDVLTFSHTWSVAENTDEQYNYSDFCNGTKSKLEASSGGGDSCLAAGTMMTMADGTQKRVEDLKIGDMLMVFNHITGKLEAAPLIFNTHAGDEKDYYDVLNLQFSNGTEMEIVESHGFFDVTLMKYVYIDYENYKEFIGHKFYSDGNAVKLTKAFIEEEYTAIYCPVTYFHMNSFANGMLNTPNIPGGITGLVNYFEYDADLKYNEAAMQRDIEKYGLYTYEDFSDYISEAAYNSSPAVYLKVAVGKGMITFEEILDVIDYLLAGSLIS